jgi:hypothetical protein
MATTITKNLSWMVDICGVPAGFPKDRYEWMANPFCVRNLMIATEGHILVAVRFEDEAMFYPNEDGEKACKKLIDLPKGTVPLPFKPLKDFAAYRYSDERPEECIVHGSAMDRKLLWLALRDIEAENYFLYQQDESDTKNALTVLDGEGWRVCIMGLRNIVQTGQHPEYPEVRK